MKTFTRLPGFINFFFLFVWYTKKGCTNFAEMKHLKTRDARRMT